MFFPSTGLNFFFTVFDSTDAPNNARPKPAVGGGAKTDYHRRITSVVQRRKLAAESDTGAPLLSSAGMAAPGKKKFGLGF